MTRVRTGGEQRAEGRMPLASQAYAANKAEVRRTSFTQDIGHQAMPRADSGLSAVCPAGQRSKHVCGLHAFPPLTSPRGARATGGEVAGPACP